MTQKNEERIESVSKNIQEMVRIVKELDEETIRRKPTDDEWSMMQIIVHVGEAIPYWLKQIEGIQKDPNAKWGRGLTDNNRLVAVSEENIKNSNVKEALEKLEKIPLFVKESLMRITDEQFQTVAPSHNPNFEGKPVQFIVDHLVVKHIEGHVGQIKRNLSKLSD